MHLLLSVRPVHSTLLLLHSSHLVCYIEVSSTLYEQFDHVGTTLLCSPIKGSVPIL